MGYFDYDEKICPDCRRSYRSHGDRVFLVDGEWLCRKCFLEWAKEELTDIDIAEALGVMTMQEIDL